MARSSLLFGLLGGICNCTGLLGSGAASAALPFRLSPLTLSLASFLAPPGSIHLFRVRSQPQSGSRSVSQMEDEADCYTFGPYKIRCTEVFHSTQHSYAMVNLRPLVPGHVLVCPRREVKRFIDLTAEEVCDLWLTAKKIGGPLEHYHKASSLTFAIQDGPQAGQTVPHVHIHILPRKSGDFEKNDEIYDAIDMKEKELKEKLDLDRERKDRTSNEMAQEADKYRALFP